MERIHNRMPVMIGDEDLGKWIGEEPATDEDILGMLRPFAPERMSAWKVSKDVGAVKNQGAHLVEII